MKLWKWRKMTMALWAWTLLLALWMVGGLASLEPQASEAAQAGQVIGAGAAVFLLLVVWFMGFVALSAVWFMTRRKDAR